MQPIKPLEKPKKDTLRSNYFAEGCEKWDMDYFYKPEFLRDSKTFLKKLSTKVEGVISSCILSNASGYCDSGEQNLWLLMGNSPENFWGFHIIILQIGQTGRETDGINVLVQPVRVYPDAVPRKSGARRKSCCADIQKLSQGTVGNNHWFPKDQEINLENVKKFVENLSGWMRGRGMI